ncbi:hypothetical protein [Clostridium transplantifaecale]|uniref:hypothetical protein n=1 Tax=Clostridium transplantifaecale TaxID=2479838 RepID=UPI000F63918E|nr:hypothetical protein [Clostridium transplantifaecale]
MFDIWNADEPLAIQEYKKNNYMIRLTPEGQYCAIFCSSNNIWFPCTKEAFEASIINKDRYEWTNFHIPIAKKEIFVRDIYKSWYVTGINEELNSIDNLTDFLRKETAGYKLILIGSSAGGYLAALLSAKLNASYAIVFSAQFELKNKWAYDGNPFLRKYEETDKSRYYDLNTLLKASDRPIYYVVPIKSENDYYQYMHVKDIPCVKPIIFNSRHHGIVMLKGNMNRFLSLSQEEIQAIYEKNSNKRISLIGFSLQLEGFWHTVFEVAMQIKIILIVIYKKIVKNARKETNHEN